ncbi:AbrB family transcriptional regulator [Lyngbya confervoides]|uniref:AbrB family transcriptional regulator n=1 Tax=Lyngbya confervoides TaxID=207921 RepID=UPI0032D5AA8A
MATGKQPKAKIAEFLEAILEAQGIKLNDGKSKDGRGREASYRVSVHKNGSIVIGAAYTSEMGLQPGDEFEIKLGYKHIHLNQLKSDDSLEESED